MSGNLEKVKIVLKSFFKSMLLKMLIPFILIGALLGGIVYLITLDDATYSQSKINAPYAVSEYTDGVTINSDGQIISSMTAQQLWDDMKKNGNRALKYLETPEQLLKLMNAELITQYLDTRSNPDDPIDWNSEQLNDINSNNIQGIIKLKRSDSSGSNYTLTYVDPTTFQTYIDNYNSSGSEADRKIALSHFTLEKSNYVSGGQAATITEGQTVEVPDGLGNVHTYMGWQKITSTTSTQYKLRELAGMNFDEEGFGKINGRYVIACTTTYGTVGDYIDFYQDDGTVIPCIIGDIKNQNDAGCNEWGHTNGKCIVEFVVDMNIWYNSGHPNPGTQQCHPEWNHNITKVVNGGSYFEKPDFTGENIDANGESVNKSKDDNSEENGKNETKEITKYYAKVATWSDQTNSIVSNDPDVTESEDYTYNMTTTNINYQDMVKGYTMPFEYLWSFLVIGKDIDFSLEMSDLVYNSKIEITVYDNLQTETNITTDTYTKKNKIDTTASVTVKYGEDKTSQTSTNIEDNWSEEESKDYTVTQTIVTNTNTLNIAVTLADVWIENYSQQFVQEQPTIISSNTYNETLDDIDYPSTPNSVINDDTYGHASSLLNENKKKYKEKYKYVSGSIDNVESKIYNSTVNRKKENIDEIQTTNYVSSPPEVKEKTDPEDTDANFVNILLKDIYSGARYKVFEVSSWLFQIIEANDSTSDMLDLTKYLLNKVYGKEKFDTEFSFDEFSSGLMSVGNTTASTGGAIGSKIVETAKTKLGCQYVLGAKGPNTFDCSGFVYWVYSQIGISVPGSTDGYKAYSGSAKEISWSEANPGDILIVFNTERGTEYGHAGIYLGNDQYIHAPSTGDVVKVSSNAKSKFKHVFRFYTEVTEGTAVEGDGYDTEVTFNDRTYREYKQSRGNYQTVGFGKDKCSAHGAQHVHSNGCGPTSVAIIASGYGKNYNPGDIATLMGGAGTQSSGTTISAVLNKIGITSHAVYNPTKQAMKQQLTSGKPFVVSVDSSMGNLFTKGGHLMAILSIDSNDNVFVSNPNPNTKTGWVPLDTLYQCCDDKYAIFVDKD